MGDGVSPGSVPTPDRETIARHAGDLAAFPAFFVWLNLRESVGLVRMPGGERVSRKVPMK